MSLTELISIDSSGWIERFTKGPKASQYKQVIESTKPKEIITSVVVLYEVYKKIKKLKGEEEALLAVAALSHSLEYNLHFSDALVYATARHSKAKLYTSDADLRSLKTVCFI